MICSNSSTEHITAGKRETDFYVLRNYMPDVNRDVFAGSFLQKWDTLSPQKTTKSVNVT